jgi:hypothetical protein
MPSRAESDVFAESRSRIRRAAAHRNAFAGRWNALIEKDAYRFTPEIDTDGTGRIRFFRTKPVGNDLALDLGEFFYQLRAALDCLIYSAILQIAGTPVPNEEYLMFPIFQRLKDFNSRAKYLVPLPDELRFWLKRIQSNEAAKDADELIRELGWLLNFLNDCARKDRHRRLHVIAAHGVEASGTINFTPAVELLSFEGVSCNLLDDEGILAEFQVARFVPNLKMDLTGQLQMNVFIQDVPVASGTQVTELLDYTGRAVDIIIRHFETALGV